MSHITRGRLTASQITVRLDGVCDHPASRVTFDGRVRVGDSGGDTALLDVGVGDAWLAVEVRVPRLRGEESVDCAWAIAVAVSGSGNSLGWLRVATMFATDIELFIKVFGCRLRRYRKCDAEVEAKFRRERRRSERGTYCLELTFSQPPHILRSPGSTSTDVMRWHHSQYGMKAHLFLSPITAA